MARYHCLHRAVVVLAGCVLLFAACRKRPSDQTERTPTITRLESVLESTGEELTASQAKITDGGEQTKPIRTIVLYTSPDHRSISAFRPFYRPIQHDQAFYRNDGLPESYVRYFQISRTEMLRVARGAQAIVQGGEENAGQASLSFSLIRHTATNTVGFDFLIPDALRVPFYRAVVAGIADDRQETRKAICGQAGGVMAEKVPGCN